MRKLAQLALLLFVTGICLIANADPANSIQGHITAINEQYGNIDTDLTAQDMMKLDVKQGDSVTITAGNKHFSVYLGTTYSDVPKGDWVAFLTTDGTIRFARNFDNAARALGVNVGDTISISK